MEIKEFYKLTKPQNSIWFTEQYLTNTSINNICGTITIKQKVDFKKLSTSICNLISGNDVFRLQLTIDNNVVKQYLLDYTEPKINYVDLKDLSELKPFLNNEISKPFSIFNNPLYRLYIYKFPDGTGGFTIIAHHIIVDAWSCGKIIDYVMDNYKALLNNETFDYSKPSYIDFINKDNEYLSSNKFEKDKQYWDSVYSTIPELATIPSQELAHSSTVSYDGNRIQFTMDKVLMEKINTFCHKNRISVFNIFMAVLAIYTANVCNLRDFTIGTPLLNRLDFKDKQTIRNVY